MMPLTTASPTNQRPMAASALEVGHGGFGIGGRQPRLFRPDVVALAQLANAVGIVKFGW